MPLPCISWLAIERRSIRSPYLLSCVERLQIHVLRFIFSFHEEAADLAPSVLAFYSIVINHVRRTVDRYGDFFQVGKNIFFRIPCTSGVLLQEQKQDACQRPSLRVHFDVNVCVCISFDRHIFNKDHVVI